MTEFSNQGLGSTPVLPPQDNQCAVGDGMGGHLKRPGNRVRPTLQPAALALGACQGSYAYPMTTRMLPTSESRCPLSPPLMTRRRVVSTVSRRSPRHDMMRTRVIDLFSVNRRDRYLGKTHSTYVRTSVGFGGLGATE